MHIVLATLAHTVCILRFTRMRSMRRVAIFYSNDVTMDLVLHGIDGFCRTHTHWIVRSQLHPPQTQAEVNELLDWHPEGLLAVATLPAPLTKLGLPWVSLRQQQSQHAVIIDEKAIGEMAADHASGLGAATCLYLIPENEPLTSGWQIERRTGFSEGLAKRGIKSMPLHYYPQDGHITPKAFLLDQLKVVRLPCVIFCGNDWFAIQLLELIREAGFQVPGDFAIIGADDLPRSATMSIPLSTVCVPHAEIGHRGAQLLDDIMAGKVVRPHIESVSPVKFCARASTESVAVDDLEVYAVVRFIRSNAGESFTVEDAISVSNLGRRSLEQKFRKSLGHSILDEIHHARIARAQHLLSETSDTVAGIALQCGFKDAAHFSLVFKKISKATPRTWRQEAARKKR